ncbi:MAG: aspartate kinase [Bacteroidota bacterium]|nr:aspartate kinase [Flavobacteriaceae bacterium]MEC8615282.1 aspartate kinase [Bacteroidota bacterium]|tara:strand:+ start:525 stop:1781 length:1257 start_codon:yes stop_codon:yes gene_type:complete
MKIFKFGGASVKDAESIKNVASVLNYTGYDNTIIVVSAIGKTTNLLEKLVKDYVSKSVNLKNTFHELIDSHLKILNELNFNNNSKLIIDVKKIIQKIKFFLDNNKSPNYDFIYDQVVSFGEIISTTIVSQYLNSTGILNKLIDAREIIKTDSYYRDSNVDWETSQTKIKKTFNSNGVYVTQGFIGSDYNNFTTTLGREGSDYTAAIIAYSIDAKEVIIWKDVPGVLNADPKEFKKTKLLNKISYREAIELAYYGASVIHPKTLQPLQKKEIPLIVKSFMDPKGKGTVVSKGSDIDPLIPCYIVKKNQVLLRLSSLDFSFIVENNISEIFRLLDKFKMKVDLIQNSAISFSVCINDKYNSLDQLISELKPKFKVQLFEEVSLYTIRHFNSDKSGLLSKKNANLLLEQRLENTLQLVIKN